MKQGTDIRDPKTSRIFFNKGKTMVMDIHGNDFPLVFHLLRQMGCLAAWGSTKIKDQVPRFRGKHICIQHGTFILDVKEASPFLHEGFKAG